MVSKGWNLSFGYITSLYLGEIFRVFPPRRNVAPLSLPFSATTLSSGAGEPMPFNHYTNVVHQASTVSDYSHLRWLHHQPLDK
ncbi:hypothetical protein M413DRAFT_382823 [Hebeloma cylindrosporum]|uniref:Uncharacterized protein n=1 Tax=Hebeloma cylindrosporum TaxID=76867 RepID=A0A0C3CIQ0_HEBCY|nr:hypothetical protein M413DRAFT_382823 [Hebeloma cylindrosporum h7]